MEAGFNPTALINILVGAGRVAGKRTSQKILKSFQEGLRDEIDASLPVIYLLEADVIVDSMLDALSPLIYDEKDLGRFLSAVYTDEGPSSFSEVTYTGSGKTRKEKINPGDPGTMNAYIIQYNKVVLARDTLVQEVHAAIQNSSKATISVNQLSKEINDLYNEVAGIIQKIVALGIPITSGQDVRLTRTLRALGGRLRRLVKTTSIVSDPKSLFPAVNPGIHTLIVAPNFNTSKVAVNKEVTKVLTSFLEKYNIAVKQANFSAGYFAAAGHSGIKTDTGFLINTPQLQTAKVVIAQAGLDMPGGTEAFIRNTGHLDYVLEVSKEQSVTGNNLISLGISVVRSQPFKFNSGILAAQETAEINSQLNSILDISYLEAVNKLKEAAQKPSFYNYLINEFRMSPTIVETMTDQILEALRTGKTGKSVVSKRKADLSKPSGKGSLSKTKKTGNAATQRSKVPKPKQVPLIQVQTSLVSLQNLINANLADQIKKNMGDGNRRDVLNLRTGRLAESAKVERMSESRAGMITAFYSYMKNPYATFSEGGRQQYPRTRDPKLLISKSIREIAQQQVANRLRAVLI